MYNCVQQQFYILFQSNRQLWMEVADKITMAVQQIIEFAKMVPGFMDLSQDDQIMLLKAGIHFFSCLSFIVHVHIFILFYNF